MPAARRLDGVRGVVQLGLDSEARVRLWQLVVQQEIAATRRRRVRPGGGGSRLSCAVTTDPTDRCDGVIRQVVAARDSEPWTE